MLIKNISCTYLILSVTSIYLFVFSLSFYLVLLQSSVPWGFPSVLCSLFLSSLFFEKPSQTNPNPHCYFCIKWSVFQKFQNSSIHKFSNDIYMHIHMHTYILYSLSVHKNDERCKSYTDLVYTAVGPICHRTRIITLVTTTWNHVLRFYKIL